MSSQYAHFLSKQQATNTPTRHTKIIATIGPACENEEMLHGLINAGMNIARFNTKHNTPEWHMSRIDLVRRVASQLQLSIPILLDIQGPEIRIRLQNEDAFDVAQDEKVVFVTSENALNARNVLVPAALLPHIEVRQPFFLADGHCAFIVTEKSESSFTAQALEPCKIKHRKNFTIPGVAIDLPVLVDADLQFLDACKDKDIEFIGLSAVNSAADIAELRTALQARNMKSDIIAKVETQAGLDHLAEIIAASDAVMVARGGMGVDLPYYQFPHWQKIMIQQCNAAHKPVITATQMLLSMVENPLPTRAEVSDVANAVYDGTDAVMLSEETTIGKYPLKVVRTQAEILEYHEQFVTNSSGATAYPTKIVSG